MGGALLAAVLVVAGCGTGRPPAGEEGAPPPAARTPPSLPTREPFVRVAVSVGADSVRAAAPGGLRVRDVTSGESLPGGPDPWRFRVDGDGVAVETSGDGATDGEGNVRGGADAAGRGAEEASGPYRRLRLEARNGTDGVSIDGRAYRGVVELYTVPGHGLVVVNQLALETYLLGVVPVEIGPRRPDELEAVRAQAVAARTYALRHLGRRDSLGFDVFGSVLDQVYGGREAERPEVTRAVRATGGEVLVRDGRPIRAYYHSTGGGLTARVSDVWNLPDAPYLRRVSDDRPDGGHYCDISPRYRWTERWTADELEAAVEVGVEEHFGGSAGRVGEVTGVEVLDRGPGGRVASLEVRTAGGRFLLTKNDIRFFLRTSDGRVLRSTRFEVAGDGADGGGLHLEGRGYGHGIGMCQWGAIGRARAGHGYRGILAHYYPGTRLRDLY